MTRYQFVLFAFGLVGWVNSTHAGVITAAGSVTAITHRSQFGMVLGQADFGAGHATYSSVPPNTYAGSGLILHGANGYDDGIENDAVSLASIVPGVTSVGYAILAAYEDTPSLFTPIAGGGTRSGNNATYSFTGSFTVPITQFGLTLSKNGVQYITAWSANGTMIGQVTWDPQGVASFVGLSSGTTPIKMVTVGNDDVFAGAVFEYQGSTTIFDDVIWGVPEPLSLTLAIPALGLPLKLRCRRRR
jgi:hypothetical protein